MKKYTWKLWLKPNLLTHDEYDSVAEVSTVGNTKLNADIARAIKEAGSDLQIETLIDVLERSDRVKRQYLLEGSSVQDGNFRHSPRVLGKWIGPNPSYDPDKHRLTFDATMTAEMRKLLGDDVDVEVLFVQAGGGAFVGLVTDVTTRLSDGTITPDGDLIIHGEKIKVAPDDEQGLGLSFVDEAGTDIPLTHPLSQNGPKVIRCRVPASLTAGTYTLKIVTRYSTGQVLLNHPRTILYPRPLTVL